MSCGRQYYGILMIVLSCFLGAFIGVFVQSVKNRIFVDITGLSQVVQMLLLLPLIIFKDVKFNFKRRTIVLSSLHCLTGALGDAFLCYSYTVLPLRDATAIYSTNLVFTSVFSVFILKSSFRWSNFGSSFLCLIGVIIISQPNFLFAEDEQIPFSYKGIAAGIAASILDSLYFNLNSLLDNVNHLLLTMFLGLNTIFLWVLYLISNQHLPVIGFADCSWTNLYITAIGVTGLLCMLAITRGFQLVEAGPGSIACSSLIVFGYIFQLLTQDAPVQIKSIVGALLIIIAMLISSWNISYNKNNVAEHVVEDISQSTSSKGNPRSYMFQEALESYELHSLIDKD